MSTVDQREEWRAILGYEGSYEVSSLGRVKSLVSKRPGLIRRQYRRPDGYMQVQLKIDQVPVNRLVHTLVDEAFNGPRVAGLEVNHKDGVKSHNAADNLDRVTRSENIVHAFASGLNVGAKGEAHPGAVLSDAQVRRIREEVGPVGANGRFRYGVIEALARRYEVSRSCVSEIVRRKRWTHVQ